MSLSQNFPTIPPSLLLDFANVKALDPRVTFTRASAARYYDGVTTAKAEENLLTYSQEFDNAAWSKNAVSVTANTTVAPDGTTTADRFTSTAGDTEKFVSSNVFSATSGQRFVFSCWAKKDTHDFVQIAVSNQTASFANFNLATGVVGTSGGIVSSAIVEQPAGSGFYRISMVFDASNTTTLAVLLCLVGSSSATRRQSFNAAGTETVDFWGAQAEVRASLTAYTPTTTQPITNYIPVLLAAQAGVPRFDHNPTTGVSLGLLIEEQRTNLLLYSEQFDDAYWTKTRTTITANTNIAPSGALTADAFYDVTGSGGQSATQRAVTTTAASHTFSVYAKYLNKQWIRLTTSLFSFGTTYFDLQNGVIGTVNANHTAAISSVGNGWYRISITFTATAAVNTFYIEGAAGNGVPTYTPVDGQGYFIWGAQLEAGTFPTSYIPTVASQVTRSADAASMTGTNFSSWYRADEGTIYSESVAVSNILNPRYIYTIYDGTASNFIAGFYGTDGTQSSSVVTANVTQAALNTPGVNSGKVAFAYKQNDAASSLNSGTALTDTSCVLPVVNQFAIGGRLDSGFRYLNGHIRKIAFYPLRLANAQLQALTTV
jgi:hypothetical protein